MGTAFVRAGDRTNYVRLCQLLLAAPLDKQDRYAPLHANRYAKTCFLNAPSLSPEFRQAALELARFAVDRGGDNSGWTDQTGGIAEYYAGQPERARELLLQAEKDEHVLVRGIAMVFRAMALNKLSRPEEAARVLRAAENLLSPSLKTRPAGYFWWDFEQAELALHEARQLIRAEPR